MLGVGRGGTQHIGRGRLSFLTGKVVIADGKEEGVGKEKVKAGRQEKRQEGKEVTSRPKGPRSVTLALH